MYPKYIRNKNINALNNEIALVNSYLNDDIKYEEVNNYLNNDITSLNMRDLEEALEKYINDTLINYNNLKENTKIDILLPSNINKELEDNLKERQNKVLEIKEELDKIVSNKNEYLSNGEYESLYNDFVNRININGDEIIDEFNNQIDEEIEVIKFLNSNKNWKIEEDKVIFVKRSAFDSFKKLNSHIINYELTHDKEGPVITASNITIIKGNKINIKDKVKCQDNVDDTVECKIDGTYDINKVGSYTIKISASDKAGNTSTKSIKLTVQEEKKNPYYIEVIRNQNVVIVYGLDSNNKYTKIVKVFVCSVGKSGKTPTGTFKTSDKSSWGRLVGNVYGQYYTRIVGDILFHSVPYYKKDKSTLEWEEYNKLGTAASKGCVRLSVRDVKWIYDNCGKGTVVKIYDGNLPSGVSKPSAIKIDGESPNKGWDPTDPDKKNPWR